MTTALPPARSVVGRLCGMVSDDFFGYAGRLWLLIEQATPYPPGGSVVLVGRWHINWSPSIGDSEGIFLGLQNDTSVVLQLEEQGLGATCPTVDWSGPVDSIGNWGELFPVSDSAGECFWARHPVMFATDTTSDPWPF